MSRIIRPTLVARGPHFALSGRVVRVDVLERGLVVKSLPAFKNLILNAGLDRIGAANIATVFSHCCVGTGNTAPAVGQTQLVAESVRTQNYLTGPGNCGTTRNTATRYTLRRTWDFPAETGPKNYTELGFGWSATGPGNLFSRVLIQSGGSPITLTLVAGQQLRVVYELTVDFSAAVQNWNIDFGGAWGVTTGTAALQNTALATLNAGQCDAPISCVWETGSSPAPINTGHMLEPNLPCAFQVASTNAALAAVGSANARAVLGSQKTMTVVAYTAGTYFRDKTVTFTTNEVNGSHASLVIGNVSANGQWWAALFSAAKVKTNLATVTYTVRTSWGRA